MIDLVYKNATGYKSISQSFYEKIFATCTEFIKMDDKRIELSLNLVNAAEMRRLNSKYRHKDKITDVLSFPLHDDKLSGYGIIPLGDIFVCPSFVETDSRDRGVDFKEELIRVCIHGFLHLAGYDHETSSKDEKKMIDVQEKILKKIA